MLELELATMNAQIKAKDTQRFQLYTQAKALDSQIVLLAEKQKALEHALEMSNKGLAEAEAIWTSLFHKFQEARLPPLPSKSIIYFAYFTCFSWFSPFLTFSNILYKKCPIP